MNLEIELEESSGPRAPRFSYHVTVRVRDGRVAVSEHGARARAFERPLTPDEDARLSALLADYSAWRAGGDLTGGDPRRAGVSYNRLVIRDAEGDHVTTYFVTQKADRPWLDALVAALRSLPG